MKEETKRVTIYDIAKEANVSRQTVSRVLNNVGSIRPETRERVLEVIKKLDFHPDPLARGLALNRSYVIGVVSISFTGYNYGRILEGAESRASELGFHTLISRASSNTSIECEPVDSKIFEMQRIEGLLIIYHGSRNDEFRFLEQISPNLPIVTIGYAANNPRVTCVQIDNFGGAKLAVEHLLSQGRKRILNLAGPEESIEVFQRTKGYSQMLADHGLVEISQLTTYCQSWNVGDGEKKVREVLEKGIVFDAIFAHSDLLAIGAMHALRKKGFKVPEDIPIIGFDDQPISEFLDIPLTTVHRPSYHLGRQAMQTLIQNINDDQGNRESSNNEELEPSEVGLDPYLVIRASCP
jgi:DNA-binding LacI/PurR family transcriptional regulator